MPPPPTNRKIARELLLRGLLAGVTMTGCAATPPSTPSTPSPPPSRPPIEPWPAEPLGRATNLTPIEGPGANDFHLDLSGASWNSATRTLWVVRNGPGGEHSKLWALVEDGAGGFAVDERDGLRAEWTGFGDLEGVTQVDLDEEVVYLMIEGVERIQAYDVSTFGTALLLHDWDVSAWLPTAPRSGAEAIAFVPDAFLVAAGFVDAGGVPVTSAGGMGGLMFVGHQNGGAIYVFDLDRAAGGIEFIGAYGTGRAETAGLEFDRSTGLLYAWHDADIDLLSVFDLASVAGEGEPGRRLVPIRVFAGPSMANNEGIAVMERDDCMSGGRGFFMTVDGGGLESLIWYHRFAHGCSWRGGPE